MELRQLRYFSVLAEELHFARAADRLGIAQPSLSTQIQALEASLGTRLFSRAHRAVKLTAAGAVFLEEARRTITQADRAISVGRRAGRGEIGSIRIGMAPGITLSGIPSKSIAKYRENFPEIELQLSIMSTNRQLSEIRGNSIDVGFLIAPKFTPEELQLATLCSEGLIVAMPIHHPFASMVGIEPALLKGESFLVIHPDTSTGIYESMTLVATHGNFTPRITRIERDLIAVLSLVGAGFGLFVLSESISRIDVPNVVYRPLLGLSATIKTAIALRRGETATHIRSFIEISKDCARPDRSNDAGGAGPSKAVSSQFVC
jgi:DNA-binding transcriptional LysR family regulator